MYKPYCRFRKPSARMGLITVQAVARRVSPLSYGRAISVSSPMAPRTKSQRTFSRHQNSALQSLTPCARSFLDSCNTPRRVNALLALIMERLTEFQGYSESSAQAPRRSRRSKGCVTCRKRKVKCGKLPCKVLSLRIDCVLAAWRFFLFRGLFSFGGCSIDKKTAS